MRDDAVAGFVEVHVAFELRIRRRRPERWREVDVAGAQPLDERAVPCRQRALPRTTP